MPRDLGGMGRYPPQPRYQPFAFYTAVRVDPYFVTQDNGAGAPLHFAVTFAQLDMAHHLLNLGAAVNQRDGQGWTPLHRAAHLAHLDGYIEIYEYLLSLGADPSVLSDDVDPYLDPGRKTPLQARGATAGDTLAPPVAVDDEAVRARLEALNARYASVPKAPLPHPDIGDWWALYDYGPETVASWPADFAPPYPEEAKRARDRAARAAARAERKRALAAARVALAADGYSRPFVSAAPAAAAAATEPSAAAAGPAAAPAAMAATQSSPLSSQPPPVDGAGGGGGGPNVFLFPGQGSQAVGMVGPDVAALPAVRAMLKTAGKVLGYDILEVIQKGPQERLDDTAVAQPALLIADLAAAAALDARAPEAARGARAAAGLSLGEYAALTWAGALSFEDALKASQRLGRVVKVRAESMAEAARAGGRPHGMLSVVGLGDSELAALCRDAAGRLGPGTVCEVANKLFPTGRVVSGHNDALDLVQAAALEAGALKAARLAVGGAFHTRLMAPARAALEAALASVKIAPPRVPVWSNVTAAPFPADPDSIRQLLARQLVEPVQWEATLAALAAGQGPEGAPEAARGASEAGARVLHELGPGQQIKSMVRRVSAEAWRGMVNVGAA
ncbi:hypothetical protein Rsub_04940 [Raphidocelis subcapitata]|uniref:Malonyl-CoA:ACP transacylase (MAT) domain-containing protein n=1 Tax=Raphidocelis subcapitata TaxID=307507 RepID=A0A2V0P421_9CHLO|nr:hypothetical protein Rsub_04940 [Raphidocelis subcapitata]|eukprot:GBF91835.1 hypothetical protein Rsub_04940 [Raphidocelis subcapitata]